MMIEKLNLELPTHVDNCQEKKQFFSSNGRGRGYFFNSADQFGKLFFQVSAKPPAKKMAGQIDKETMKKRIRNIEQGIMNVEVRYSIINYY